MSAEYQDIQEYSFIYPSAENVTLDINFPSNLSSQQIRERLRTNYIRDYLNNNRYIGQIDYRKYGSWYDIERTFHHDEPIPNTEYTERFIDVWFRNNHCFRYYL